MYAEWHADDDRENDGDDAELKGDRELAGDQLLDRFGTLRSIGRAEIKAEDPGHVIQESAVNKCGGKRDRIPDARGERLLGRIGVEPEWFVEAEFGVERFDGCRGEGLLSVPRAAWRPVHEKEGDCCHGDDDRDHPQNSAECVLQHHQSLALTPTTLILTAECDIKHRQFTSAI